MKVRELIAELSTMNPEAEVFTKPVNAQSRSPWPRESEGFKSSYGCMLTLDYYGGREAQQRNETFPVVWL